MPGGARRWLRWTPALLVAVAAAVGIGRLAPWGAGGGEVSPGPSAGASHGASARAPVSPASASPPAKELEGVARIPVSAAEEARKALVQVAAGRDPAGPAYLAFRRAVARGEPFFRGRGFQAEALFGGGVADEVGGALGRLDAALAAGDAKATATHAAEADGALRLLGDSMSRSPVKAAQLPDILARATYWLGAAVAGSKPGLSRSPAAAVADALGMLDAIEQGVRETVALISPAQDTAEKVTPLLGHIEAVRKPLLAAAATGELRDRAAIVVRTGLLGASLRPVLWPSSTLWRPYSSRVRTDASALDEPITVLTVPALSRAAGRGAPPRDEVEEERLAALGERLFSDRALSAGGARSCATCHVPEKAYSDGKVRPESLLPEAPILRNTPTLLYASLHAAQFWDGRALTSERQAVLVMHSKAEMGVPDTAFPRPGVASEKEAAAALSAFQARRLTPASSPLDRFARGDEGALSAEDRAGFDVFAGKGRCARCHVPPLFGGSQPPDFATAVYSVLGVPETEAGKKVDPDRGRAAVTRREIDHGAFKTPTVRNIGRTAPYFHNGAFATLEAVIDFYDKGGGKGLGLAVDNQDPDVVPLKLTEGEKRDLLRFLRVGLADALSGAPARPR